MSFGLFGICISGCGAQNAISNANVQIAQEQAAALAALTAQAATPPPTIGDYAKYGFYGLAGIAAIVIVIKLVSKGKPAVAAAPAVS